MLNLIFAKIGYNNETKKPCQYPKRSIETKNTTRNSSIPFRFSFHIQFFQSETRCNLLSVHLAPSFPGS